MRVSTQEYESQQRVTRNTYGKEVTGTNPAIQKKDISSKVDTKKTETTAKIDVQQSLAQARKESTGTDANLCTEKGGTDSKNIEQALKSDINNSENSQLGGEEATKLIVSPHLLSQYEQFSQQIGKQNNPQVDDLKDQDIEIIPKNPTGEIMLKIEEIPPLDIFYSPKHRVVVRKQRKRRKTDQDAVLTSQVEFMNIVYKNAEVNPSEDLTKLSQYAGAYNASTIDKASEVTQSIKNKYVKIAMLEEHVTENQQKIIQLEQRLQDGELKSKKLEEQISIEKENIDQQNLEKQKQLNQEIAILQALLQNEQTSKIEQEKMFQSKLDKFKNYPILDQFKN